MDGWMDEWDGDFCHEYPFCTERIDSYRSQAVNSGHVS